MNRKFVVLIRSFYGTEWFPKTIGPIGSAPDPGLMESKKRIWQFSGRYIPDYLKHLKFIFHTDRAQRERQSIYVYFDFWLVSDAQKQELEKAANSHFEFAPAHTFEDTGERTQTGYWIAKVIRTVNCINANQSYVESPLYAPSSVERKNVSLTDEVIEFELTEDLTDRFANHEHNVYRTFPDTLTVSNLILNVDNIPEDCPIFTPTGWPGNVLCDSEFYRTVIMKDHGYSIWALDLPNVRESYRRAVHNMR